MTRRPPFTASGDSDFRAMSEINVTPLVDVMLVLLTIRPCWVAIPWNWMPWRPPLGAS